MKVRRAASSSSLPTINSAMAFSAMVTDDAENGPMTSAAPRGLSLWLYSRGAGSPGAERSGMGQPVVHFEIIGRDAGSLQSYYSELFGWRFDTSNPMNYGVVAQDDDAPGIGGGVGAGPDGYDGHVTFYVAVPDVEAALARAESLGGSRMMGPEKVMEQIEIGLFADPEGHVVGVVKEQG
jgi:predicted enzyme related to lactoylglutathione lyase